MMQACFAVFLREMLILKRRVARQAAAAAISPLLYMLTFGYALGGELNFGGLRYLDFLLPGLAAMASMTQAFGIASEINIARFYSRVFEDIQASPGGRLAYVAGEAAAGLVRVLIGCCVILLLGWLFGVRLHYGVVFWAAAFLNGLAFASLAIALAMLVTSHADQSLLGSFVITPMAFLGGTFFPLDKMPEWARGLLSFLPLTHAARLMRADAFGQPVDGFSFLLLLLFASCFFLFAIYAVGRAKD